MKKLIAGSRSRGCHLLVFVRCVKECVAKRMADQGTVLGAGICNLNMEWGLLQIPFLIVFRTVLEDLELLR